MKTSNYSAIRGAVAWPAIAQSDGGSRRPFSTSRRKLLLQSRFIVVFVLTLLMASSASAQIQQAWVARYNNGILNGTNQAVKMALDSSGNIYVTGFSQNANTNLGCVTIKYAPNGDQVWATRYDSTNYPSAMPTALALDSSNNVLITGSALTIKYDLNGNQLWTAPYAGTALAVDTNGNCIVTGISTSFGTVKLNPNGSNLWIATYPSSYGPGAGQQVVTAADNSVYVAGYYTFLCQETMCYQELLLVKYDQNGNQLWVVGQEDDDMYSLQVEGLAIDAEANAYIVIHRLIPLPSHRISKKMVGCLMKTCHTAGYEKYKTSNRVEADGCPSALQLHS
jgi:hypothetical protein